MYNMQLREPWSAVGDVECSQQNWIRLNGFVKGKPLNSLSEKVQNRHRQYSGNPAVYGYKFIVFLLLYIYALNHASDQCTKCAVMLRVKNIHTVIIVDEIDHFVLYLPPLCT